MKYIVNQSKFKDFLRNKFNFDLTGKIKMITNRYQVPNYLDRIIPGDTVNELLNKYGPMYLITMDEDNLEYYLFQEQNNGDNLLLDRYDWLTEHDFMDMLKIGKLGLSMKSLIDIYFEEEE